MGCQYTGPYVDIEQDVNLTYSATAAATVYVRNEASGKYYRERSEGSAQAILTGGADWDLPIASQLDSRLVVQPFCDENIILRKGEGGKAELVSAAGRDVELEFVTGSWEEFEAGEDVVFKLSLGGWQAWSIASQDAFLGLLEMHRRVVDDQLRREQTVSPGRVVEFDVDQLPLIRANLRQVMIFTEPQFLAGLFTVFTHGKDPSYAWWLTSYELRPEVQNFLVGFAEVTAYVAVEIMYQFTADSLHYALLKE